ncbi:MAG: hypothetical protein KAG99_07180 [Bacteroidales bacterium]|nr:hypothetical protein [Bacteroidales bacterium]
MNEIDNDSSGNIAPPNKSKTAKILSVILVILLLVIIGLVWKFMSTRNEVNQLVSEKENMRIELQLELDSLMLEHDNVKVEYGTLADSLALKDSVIQANATEIKKLLNTQWEYYKIKKKLNRLRGIARGYVHQIDSLHTVNRELQEENTAIKMSYAEEQRKSSTLQKDKEELTKKVSEAAVLKAYGISAYGIRYKSVSNQRFTDKARRVDKVKICYTLADNPVVQKGIKEIFIRIARPDNLILSKGEGDEYSFMYNGEILQYSIKEEVDYDNLATDVCSFWVNVNLDEPLIPGKYAVSIFTKDYEIGQTFFELK